MRRVVPVNYEPLAGIISNAALLLALWVVYEATFLSVNVSTGLKKVLVGIVIGLICVALMLNPWELSPGIFFDTHSILLGITGLFFGLVPTLIAMSVAAIFRLYQGGAGVWMGVSVIITSSLLGLLWNSRHEKLKGVFGKLDLYVFGLTVHVTMLLCTFLLPPELVMNTLGKIFLPVLLTYPLVTVLLGNMLNYQIDRKRSQESLLESEELFKTVFEQSAVGMAQVDPDFIIRKVNARFCRIVGSSAEELAGKDMRKMFLTAGPDAGDGSMGQLLEGNPGSCDTERQYLRKDGQHVWIHLYMSAVRREDGSLKYAIAVITDITERRAAKESLEESEERFKLFMDNFPGYAYIKDETGRHLFCNRKLEERLGSSCEDLVGKSNEDVFPADTARHFSLNDQLVLQNRDTLVTEEQLLGDNGTETFLTYKFAINRKQGLPYLGGISLDITDRKQAAETLKIYNQRLSILHRIDKGIISAHSSEEIANTVLQCLRRMIGCSNVHLMLFEKDVSEASVFASNGDVGTVFYEDARFIVQVNRQLSELHSGYVLSFHEVSEFESLFSPASGSISSGTFLMAITAPLLLEGELIGTLGLLSSEPGFFNDEHLEIVQEVANQLAIAIQQARLNEQIGRHSCDLEESVKQRTAQLEAANKELEAFAYSVSHDLRSPLRAIDGFSRIIVEDYAERLDEEGNRLLNVVRDNAQKMDKLITDLLSLSRVSRNEMNLTKVDMSAMAGSVYRELASPEVKARFNVDIGPMPQVYADPVLMRQVWSNLVSNAIKYTLPRDEPFISMGGYRENGKNVYYVKDTGVGFDPKYEHKLFGLFQRLHTEKEFEGTGVGLAILQRIVHRHGGSVWAEGAVNEGATFYFSLPVKEVSDNDGK